MTARRAAVLRLFVPVGGVRYRCRLCPAVRKGVDAAAHLQHGHGLVPAQVWVVRPARCKAQTS